ncbi:MAG TPA: flavin reductase [Steroidobacteraceae bacterium]|jgi:3-hydroxy-9,10-secoandrosta-1,3,5(10)-triene-9,17-dione monooxygenase reductase component|nr:flavin reductase [Steroidobacteraceae bacterium]
MATNLANALDTREFRSALGAFATGVTLVTTRRRNGEPVGLTANSFNSVSLEPPLVLWSLARSSSNLDAFSEAEYWAVHILASDQESLSSRFGARRADKFSGLTVENGMGGVPLLPGCTARFQCRTAFQYDGGDHIIFVGEVLAFDRTDSPPLLFHGGSYAVALQRASLHAPGETRLEGDVVDDFLSYLLGRGHALYRRQLKASLRAAQINGDEHLVLSVLMMHDGLTATGIETAAGHVLHGDVAAAVQTLRQRDLISNRIVDPRDAAGNAAPAYGLTPAGRACALRLLAASKSYEAEMVERLGANDSAVLKSLLRKLLAVARNDA